MTPKPLTDERRSKIEQLCAGFCAGILLILLGYGMGAYQRERE